MTYLRIVIPLYITIASNIDNVGHWVQHEASDEVSAQLVKFRRTVNPT
jgi:hypothetical protein